MVIKNKKGWIRVIEAVVSIVLIVGVVLLIINTNKSDSVDSRTIYNLQTAILREIQLNNTLRDELISIANLPLDWTELFFQAPKTWITIVEKTPGYLECRARLCLPIEDCLLENPPDQTIYTEESLISSSLQTYSPRILKVFCWEE